MIVEITNKIMLYPQKKKNYRKNLVGPAFYKDWWWYDLKPPNYCLQYVNWIKAILSQLHYNEGYISKTHSYKMVTTNTKNREYTIKIDRYMPSKKK